MLLSTMKGNTAASVVSVAGFAELSLLIHEHDWSPAIFKQNYRNNENFEQTEIFVLDVDDGLSLSDARTLFAPYAHIIATTRNHQKEKDGKPACDRYRVILRLSTPIKDRDTFYATFFDLFAAYPFIDDKCKDPARFFYKCTDVFIEVQNEGAHITPSTPKPKEIAKPRAIATNADNKGRLSEVTQHFLFAGADSGKWNDRLFKAAKDAYEQGYAKEWFETRAFLVMEEKRDNFDADKRTESHKTIDSAYAKAPRYNPRGIDVPDVRDTILKCHLFVANHDVNLTRLIDMENTAVHNISHEAIKLRLGTGKGGEYPMFKSEKLRYVNFTYDPHMRKLLYTDRHGIACLNMYEPPDWRKNEFYFGEPLGAQPTLPPLYEEFFNHLVGGNKPSFEYLLDWLANSLRSRNYTILCAIGEQGVGKGILGEIMERLHGPSNFVKVRDQVFKSQFNAQLENRTIVHVDEVWLDTKESIDRIKDVVNGNVNIEKKGEDSRSLCNFASYYLVSNSLDAIKLEPGDRRFSIIELTDTKIAGTALMDNVRNIDNTYYSPEHIEQLALYLWNRPIRSNLMVPFVSSRWEMVRESGLSEWEQWVVFDWAAKNRGGKLGLDKLQDLIQRQTGFRPPGRSKIEKLCKKYPEVLAFDKNGIERQIVVHLPA